MSGERKEGREQMEEIESLHVELQADRHVCRERSSHLKVIYLESSTSHAKLHRSRPNESESISRVVDQTLGNLNDFDVATLTCRTITAKALVLEIKTKFWGTIDQRSERKGEMVPAKSGFTPLPKLLARLVSFLWYLV